MGRKLADSKKFNNPGPGTYDPDFLLARQSRRLGGKIGSSSRSKNSKSMSKPGPGQYEIDRNLKKKGFK